MTNVRNNDAWLKDLHTAGEQRDEALNDLGTMLRRVLPRGVSNWLSPQNPEFESFIEDTVQEALLRVMNGLNTFEGRSQFTTWANKIAIRVALNELRRRRWRDVSMDELEENDADDRASRQFPASDPSPETIVERGDILRRVQEIIEEELTKRQRAAMHAIHIQGVPMEEAAQRMGTNRNALYKLLHDARVRLKNRLKREGLDPKELLEMFGSW